MQTNTKNIKYLAIVAGGSGGHILPALTLAEKWLQENPTGKIIYFGSQKKIDQKVMATYKFEFIKIDLNLINFPGKKIWLYPKFIFQFLKTTSKSYRSLKKYRPEKLISTGGYISIPVSLAAKRLKIPIDLYELNVIAGRATNFISSYANKIFVVFEKSKKIISQKNPKLESKIFVTEYPLRFTAEDKSFDKDQFITLVNKIFQSEQDIISTRAHINLGCGNLQVASFYPFEPTKKTIFILGGSQGSQYLNNLFKSWIETNLEYKNKIQIIHQTGKEENKNFVVFYRTHKIPAIIFDYKDDLKKYFLLSDLTICRAGAGTLFELEFFNKKSIIIPLQTKQTDHQIYNAEEMSLKHPDLFITQKQSSIDKDLMILSKNILKMLEF